MPPLVQLLPALFHTAAWNKKTGWPFACLDSQRAEFKTGDYTQNQVVSEMAMFREERASLTSELPTIHPVSPDSLKGSFFEAIIART